jgi:hypothetical protein
MAQAANIALSSEALLNKSKIYIARALRAKGDNSLGEYQLWASLALELLGKSALAQLHPCLIVDPNSSVSIFAAAGLQVGTDIKTITAKTLFDRLGHVSKHFDKKMQDFCEAMSLKRNAELHSGELPFEAVALASWEGRYWYCAAIILETLTASIETWIGADQARAPKEVLENYRHAISEAAKVRVERAADAFMKLTKGEREAALATAAALETWEVSRKFKLLMDATWETKCPACASKAFMAGITYGEEISDNQDDPYEELVDLLFVAEEFFCPACSLHLEYRPEIEAVGLQVEHQITESREREYEPDYGND